MLWLWLALEEPTVAREYAGPEAVASTNDVETNDVETHDVALLEPATLGPEVTRPSAPQPRSTPPPAPDPPDAGERWRFAYVISTQGYFTVGQIADVGLGFGVFLGAGVPVQQRPGRRTRHAIGYSGDLGFGWYTGARHHHRFAASGVVGRSTPAPGRSRRSSFYYYGAFGAGVFGFVAGGPSLGGRIGFASGRDLEYILSIGADLDVLVVSGFGAGMVPTFNLSLLTGGSL